MISDISMEKQEKMISFYTKDHNSSESSDSAFNEDVYNMYNVDINGTSTYSNDLKPISSVSSIFNRQYTIQIEEEFL